MVEIPCNKRKRIEETVVNILKDADLKTTSECSVRNLAAQQLSVDLSDISSKILVRDVIESFYLSVSLAVYKTRSGVENSANPHGAVQGEELLQQQHGIQLTNGGSDCVEGSDRGFWKFSDKGNVAIHGSRGKTFVSIRDYYLKDGKIVPSGRGITLTAEQWSSFKISFSDIEERIAKRESSTRSKAVDIKPKPITPDLVGDIALLGPFAIDQNQMETDISNSFDEVDHQRHIIRGKTTVGTNSVDSMSFPCAKHQIASDKHHAQTDVSSPPQGCTNNDHPASFSSQNLVPIMTTRLYGKNYYCWMYQMECFLKQLNVAYVLTDECPSIPMQAPSSSEETVQAKAAVSKWVDDEYLCRHSILNSLSDNLFGEYSKKAYNAKELWHELKSVFHERFGARSLINNYVNFQIVDGVSVIEQVNDLHKIAGSIMASGIWMDDNFHVSVIISKLPPSWKDFRAELMSEESLSVSTLLHQIKVEEDSRNYFKKANASTSTYPSDIRVENDVGPRRKEGKRLCYNCGKEGHVSKSCAERVREKRSIGKDHETACKSSGS